LPFVAETIETIDADQSAAIAGEILQKLLGCGVDRELASESRPAAGRCSIGGKDQHPRQHVSAFCGGFEQPRLAGATWAGNFDDARGRLGLVEQYFKLTSAMRATQPLMTDGCLDVPQREPAQLLDTFAGFGQIERRADLDALLAQSIDQVAAVCLAAYRVRAKDETEQDIIMACLIGAGGQLSRARAIVMFGDRIWSRIVKHQHRKRFCHLKNDLIGAAAMVGKMVFEGANEAAHILVATPGRAEKRQERLCVGRVPRQLKGLLHAVFDGSRCTLEGNGKASAGIFFAAFDYCGNDSCKYFVAFRERHRSLGLDFKASLLARPRHGLDDDVV
jgi:hypothetical protein